MINARSKLTLQNGKHANKTEYVLSVISFYFYVDEYVLFN